MRFQKFLPSGSPAVKPCLSPPSQGHIPLTVVSVRADGNRTEALDHARQLLQGKNVHADFVERKENPAYEMLQTAKQSNCNLIVMGSYGHRAILEIALGSTIDEILRSFRGLVMVCIEAKQFD